jgi:hypothetical protein
MGVRTHGSGVGWFRTCTDVLLHNVRPDDAAADDPATSGPAAGALAAQRSPARVAWQQQAPVPPPRRPTPVQLAVLPPPASPVSPGLPGSVGMGDPVELVPALAITVPNTKRSADQVQSPQYTPVLTDKVRAHNTRGRVSRAGPGSIARGLTRTNAAVSKALPESRKERLQARLLVAAQAENYAMVNELIEQLRQLQMDAPSPTGREESPTSQQKDHSTRGAASTSDSLMAPAGSGARQLGRVRVKSLANMAKSQVHVVNAMQRLTSAGASYLAPFPVPE